MKRTIAWLAVSLLPVLFAARAWAQTEAELKLTVPDLVGFHEVIYPLWYNAYANKDTGLIRQLWPEIQKQVAAVEKAELPGNLRNKKEAWQKGLEKLKAAEKAYGEALADKGAFEDKLKGAEGLRSAYESLVLAIRPAIPELVRFHEVMYQIYHAYLPNKDAQAFHDAMPLLQARMDTLNSASLPKRLENRKPEFEKARALLSEKVQKVMQNQPCCTWRLTEQAVEEMRTAYQAVEKIFD